MVVLPAVQPQVALPVAPTSPAPAPAPLPPQVAALPDPVIVTPPITAAAHIAAATPVPESAEAKHFLALGRTLIAIGQVADARAMFAQAATRGSAEGATAEAAASAILADTPAPQ